MTKAFWTITELSAELGGHHMNVRRWCHKLGLGTMAGTAYILDAKERAILEWVYSLSSHQRVMLGRDEMEVYYPEVWATRPKGLRFVKEET